MRGKVLPEGALAAKRDHGARSIIFRSAARIRKHARIKKNGRFELKKGWSDKKIAKKAKADVGLVRRLRGDLYAAFASRSCASPVFGDKALQENRAWYAPGIIGADARRP